MSSILIIQQLDGKNSTFLYFVWILYEGFWFIFQFFILNTASIFAQGLKEKLTKHSPATPKAQL